MDDRLQFAMWPAAHSILKQPPWFFCLENGNKPQKPHTKAFISDSESPMIFFGICTYEIQDLRNSSGMTRHWQPAIIYICIPPAVQSRGLGNIKETVHPVCK